MPLIPRLTSLWRNLIHKDRVDQDFCEEIQAYLDMSTEAKLRQGLSPQEARRNALLELGGVEQVEERVREIRMGQFIETIWRDVRLGMRTLVHSPIFTTVTVLSLALGIGANTAIFSVVNGLLLRPLSYPESERLVDVWHTPPQQSFPGLNRFSVSPANYLDWKAQSNSFEQIAVYGYAGLSLSTSNDPLPLIGATVSSDFFSVLRTNAMLGRTFTPDEERTGSDQVVVISHELWQRAFGANPNIVGQTVTLNSRSFNVVGIMPAGFEFPQEAKFWIPVAWDDKERQVRSIHDYLVIGRLKPNVSVQQAQAEMTTISSRLEQQYPEENKGWGAVVIPIRDDLVGDMRTPLLVLFCAVSFVLLIACANVANLMLARGANRQKEMAVRIALGAGRARLVRQLLTESVLLAVTGGLLGLLLAVFGSKLLVQLGNLPNAGDIGIDTWTLVFTLLVSFAAGIIIGIMPALQFTRTSVSETLKQGSGRTGGSSLKQYTRKALVISEVALSLVLLIGAGLMIRSFWKLQNVDPGFDTRNALTMSLVLTMSRYPEPQQRIAFADQAIEKIRAVPGVVSVGTTTKIPLSGGGSTQPFSIEGRPAGAIAEQPMAQTRYISPDYFRAIGIPLRQGRFFSDQDRDKSVPVVIISEAMARRFWPGENPIGKRLTPSFHREEGVREIVGVVGDVKARGLDSDSSTMMYLPFKQAPLPFMSFVVRTGSNPASLIQPVSKAIYSIDKDQALTDVQTMDQVLLASLSGRRFNMTLLLTFAAVALMLAAVGVYGVMNYTVTLRRRELGIRMALGAARMDVLRLVLGQGLALTLIGVGAGLISAYALTRLMASLLYGVTATDYLTFGSVSAMLVAVGLAASYIPARRATRVNPTIALRAE